MGVIAAFMGVLGFIGGVIVGSFQYLGGALMLIAGIVGFFTVSLYLAGAWDPFDPRRHTDLQEAKGHAGACGGVAAYVNGAINGMRSGFSASSVT